MLTGMIDFTEGEAVAYGIKFNYKIKKILNLFI